MDYSIIIFISAFLGILHSAELQASNKANLDTLRVSQIIFRHGARTIDKTWPNDPYKDESYWKPGYSQLTNMGKFQGYNLGLYLRERYDGFVKSAYDMKDIYVLSSDFARTMQTAYSVMAGFYLPNRILTKENETVDDYLTNNNTVEIPLPWKPVPVHTIQVDDDNIIRQKAEICPRYLELYSNLPKEDETVKGIFDEAADLIEYFHTQAGEQSTKVKDVLLNLDTLYTEQYYNLTLPAWTDKIFATDTVRSWFLFFFEFITYNDEMKRLRVGPMVERLLQNMEMNETSLDVFDRSRSGFKKMQFISAHDTTLAGLLNTLGIYDKKRPPFTTALMIELHEKVGTASLQPELFVEIYYRNETDREPYQMEIPNCGLQCPLVDFKLLVAPYIPLNWDQECQVLSESGSLSAGWIVLIVLLVWIALFVILQFWIRSTCFNFIRKRDRRDYSGLT